MRANLDQRNVGGYSVAYRRDDTNFPVYVTAALAAMFFTAAWITGAAYWLALAVTAAAFTYYNIPLLETGRPTIGANQYGIFIQAFGLIRWRAIDRIDLVEIAERAMTVHELQISLSVPLGSALVVDWRKQPAYRLLMRKVLLTAAPPPPGRSNISFNRLRLTTLLDGGYVEDAANLALRVQAPMNLDILRAQTDALLYAGRDTDVCSDLTAHRLDTAESFWVKLRAYCYAAAGGSSVSAYSNIAGATGTLTPVRTISGANTGLNPPFPSALSGVIGIAVDSTR